jgi:hypothetical protein
MFLWYDREGMETRQNVLEAGLSKQDARDDQVRVANAREIAAGFLLCQKRCLEATDCHPDALSFSCSMGNAEDPIAKDPLRSIKKTQQEYPVQARR